VKAATIANTMADQYLRYSRNQRARLAADQARTLTSELVRSARSPPADRANR
jgi:hypothetical protein